MVDSPGAVKKPSVPDITPLDHCDFTRAKTRASIRWLLVKSFGGADNVPVELRDPFYKDQYDQEHLKPSVSKLLLSPETYCKAQALLAQAPKLHPQEPPTDNSALLQLLIKKGLAPKVQEVDVSEQDLSQMPIKTKSHLALIDSMMTLAAQEVLSRVKMADEAEQMGVCSPWENALLFWVNRLNQMLRESTEDDESPKQPQCSDLQPAQDPQCQSNRWYWKLVPHAIAFCLKESGNKPPVIRYRKDKVQSKLTPTFPLVSAVKDLSNGCAIAAVLHFYCPGLLPLEDVCLKDTMSVADSVYNLQLIREFCESTLHDCCPLQLEDLLYAPAVLHLNIMSFVAELLDWFEVKKPEFVQPVQTIDLTDISGIFFGTSPVSGNSNSGSPSFVFKQPFVPMPSQAVPENKAWAKKQISRPLSAVTFSIPFGLDSDVDIVMGNPIDSVFRSVSPDGVTTGIPAVTSSGMTRVPYSPPEDLSHLVSASAPSQRAAWGPYAHTTPLGELPTIEEALQVVHIPGSKDRWKGLITENDRHGVLKRPEARLCPEGAPAGFFLHYQAEDGPHLSSSAPSHSGILNRPVGGDVGNNERKSRNERRNPSRRTSDMSRDDDSVLRDGSVDSSEASDDAPRNAPGNMRPNRQGNGTNGSSPRMTSFAERRDNRRRQPAASGEESAPTPTTPGTPHTPSQQDSPGLKGPIPGSEAWELGARLEEKRKSIEAQKRRIEAIFAKHRQRLGKTAFLKLKKEQGEEGGEVSGEDNLSLEDRLTRMEEQLKQEEEREQQETKPSKEKEEPAVSNPPRLEKQVTFSIDSKKGADREQEAEEKEVIIIEYNQVVQKLGEALQSLQKDMQKLTEQQKQLMTNQRPKSAPKTGQKASPKGNTKISSRTPPHTPTKTPPRTPTKNHTTSKAWAITPGPISGASASPPSRRTHLPPSSPKIAIAVSSSCPAPRTKIHSSSSPRSPKHHPRNHAPVRPSELKFPTFNRVLTPTHNVDTIPHLRRVSPSKCQVQTSSSFRIGGPRTPQQSPQAQQTIPDESTSDTGSSETPTQFSLELDQEDGGVTAGIEDSSPANTQAAGGSSSGPPSECSFESETLSISAVFSTGGEGGMMRRPGKSSSPIQASLSSLGELEDGTDVPTDEVQEFSSDSMSDHNEPVRELPCGPSMEPKESKGATTSPEAKDEEPKLLEGGERKELEARGGVGFFFKDDDRSEGEMAQRRAVLLERQQKRTEELKRRRLEQEQDKRPASSETGSASPLGTPPASPTPPATPARRGDFTRREYACRQQLRIMGDLDKMLRQKGTSQSRSSVKKARTRPRSVSREGLQLSRSPVKKLTESKLTKVYSHSSLNLEASGEQGHTGSEGSKPSQSCSGSPSRSLTPSRLATKTGEKDCETGVTGTSPAPEYNGPKLFKEPSFKSNKFIIHNALSRCCLAGKVNEAQKSKIVEEMEKSPANHFLILFRDSSCQFRGVYTMNPDSEELVRLAGVGPKMLSSAQVESIYKYSSDRKQFSAIPSKTMGMSVDAFTIPGHLWQGGGAAGGGGSRRASITKKAVVAKSGP